MPDAEHFAGGGRGLACAVEPAPGRAMRPRCPGLRSGGRTKAAVIHRGRSAPHTPGAGLRCHRMRAGQLGGFCPKARAGASEDDGAASGSLKELELRTGLLGVNDVFVETGYPVYLRKRRRHQRSVCVAGRGGSDGSARLQPRAGAGGAYTSNHAEWVGSVAGENEVYWSQDARRPGGTAKR